MMRFPLVRTLSIFLLSLAMVPPSSAQVELYAAETRLLDAISIERDGLDLFAFDSVVGRQASIRLELGEEVLFQATRGRIALVLTDRRALGVAAGGLWQETRYGVKETPAEIGLVKDQIGLVVTNRRALGFVGRGGWVEERFSSKETLAAIRIGAVVGLVVTNRRGLGLSSDRDGFAAIKFQIHETVESASAGDTLGTVRTNRRILVFNATPGAWADQNRKIH